MRRRARWRSEPRGGAAHAACEVLGLPFRGRYSSSTQPLVGVRTSTRRRSVPSPGLGCAATPSSRRTRGRVGTSRRASQGVTTSCSPWGAMAPSWRSSVPWRATGGLPLGSCQAGRAISSLERSGFRWTSGGLCPCLLNGAGGSGGPGDPDYGGPPGPAPAVCLCGWHRDRRYDDRRGLCDALKRHVGVLAYMLSWSRAAPAKRDLPGPGDRWTASRGDRSPRPS